MARWEIPEPVPIDWDMRTVDSAEISGCTLDDGRFRQIVKHAPLPGVTPAMCLWYLERVDQELTWRGRSAIAYRFWHPVDHIFFKRMGTFGPGDRWHIVEAFGGDRRFLFDGTFQVTSLGESGFAMELRRPGMVAAMDERWSPTPAGLSWTVTMTVGGTGPGLRKLGSMMVRRRMPFLLRWRQHNVEEAGNLPHFLPELCDDYHRH